MESKNEKEDEVNGANQVASSAIADYKVDGELRAIETTISSDEALDWIRSRFDPPRFQPSMFVGNWGDPSKHPDPGDLRIL